MRFYDKIKREHLFIFVVILVSLILFRSFDFGYEGLAVKNIEETCTQQGYSCCSTSNGEGANYFSLDNTCSGNQGCWAYCQESSNLNTVSGYFSFEEVYGNVVNFFRNLFQPSVGVRPCECSIDSECPVQPGSIATCDERLSTGGCIITSQSPDFDSDGVCEYTDDPSCQNECFNDKQCSGNGYRTCGNYDQDACLEWSAVTACSSGQICINGDCSQVCTDDCTNPSGNEICDGNGYKTCGYYDDDGCLDWSEIITCSTGQICSNGQCQFVQDCIPGRIKTGTQCLVCNFQGTAYIPDNSKCQSGTCNTDGTCAPICVDDCASGAKQCSGTGYQTCGNYDADSCTEWSTVTACSSGQTCSAGNCITPQTCTPGTTQTGTQCLVCNSAGTGYLQDNIKCASGQTCDVNGQCITPQTCTPGTIQSGTSCKVCNAQGTGYYSDNSRCSTGQTCNLAGQCILTGDTVKPVVTLVSPVDFTDNFVEFAPNSQITFVCSATDNVGLSLVELWVNRPDVGGGFLAVDSKSISGTSASATFTKSYNLTGTYAWTCRFIDSSGISAYGNINGQSAGFKIVGGSTIKEICNNDQDDDNDKAIDELDTECPSGEYVKLDGILPTYIGKSITQAKEPWEGSDINLKCTISTSSGVSLTRANNCIYASVSGTNCDLDDENSDGNVNFVCNVDGLGYKNVSCNVLSSCHAYPASAPIKQLNYQINVLRPDLCDTIVNDNNIIISDIDVDDNTYSSGDTITSALTIGNQRSTSLDVVVTMQLYDINKRTLIEEIEQTKKITPNSEADYELELIIPSSLDDSKFGLYFKVNQKSAENKLCLEFKKDLEIEGSSSNCEDLDDDGYDDESCGGDDCDDGDADINPGADEICTDLIDNDCNGFIDKSDPLCGVSQCISGDSRVCGKGICKGTQTCTNGAWGTCSGGQQSTNEMCSNSLDDDCDGFTDSSDSDCGVSGDSDNDGLPDSWEASNFGSTSLYDGGDDPDGDGKTNLEEYELGTDPNKKEGTASLFTTILIVIGVIVVALFAVWFFALRPKKPKFNYQPTRPNIQQTSIKKPFFQQKEEVNPVLKDYVKNSLRKGYTKEQIKKALVVKGWKEHEIEQAFKK